MKQTSIDLTGLNISLTEMKYRNYKSRIRHVYVKYKSLIHSQNNAT